VIIAVDGRPLLTRGVTGVEIHARNIVEAWQREPRGHRFLFITDRPMTDEQTQIAGELRAPGFEWMTARGLAQGGWDQSFHLGYPLSRLLRRQGVNVFHSFSPMVPRITACPVVQTIHDLAMELDPTVRGLAGARKERRLTRLGASNAARIVAVSMQTKGDIASIYGVAEEQIAVIHNGINAVYQPEQDLTVRQQLRDQFGVGGRYIFMVGSDIPRRNYGRVLDAMAGVWDIDPRVRLLFAGRNEWSGTPIFAKAQAMGMLGRLIFVAGPTDAMLAQLYRDAALVCCASSFEGFGLSVLEGMACGTPVACSDMRSLREVAGNAAVYFVHDDVINISQTLSGVLDDGEYRRQLRARGVERAKRFTWGAAAAELLDVLEGVVQEYAAV
jgi:glycosyltransferase involved in cell wall biosynthesis